METKANRIEIPLNRKRQLTVSYNRYNEIGRFLVPFIRLNGNYLREFDFKRGDKIDVSISKGKIFIKKVFTLVP